jgi:SnoaL-like domain
MRFLSLRTFGGLALGLLASTQAPGRRRQDDGAALAGRLAAVEDQLRELRDIEEVRRLQHIYNYYNSSGMSQQLLDLVSPNAVSIEIGGQGVYLGKAGFERLFGQYHGGKAKDHPTEFGRVIFQIVSQGVITVDSAGTHAKGRFRVLTPIFAGFPDGSPRFNGGDYEMEYVKEHGRWMISKFKYVHVFAVTFDPDGRISPGYSTLPSGREDEPTTWYHPWPETGPLPFHYPNPITGQYPPDTTGQRHYWIGNWPGEFGRSGHHAPAEAAADTEPSAPQDDR